jgi:hypothetical protein
MRIFIMNSSQNVTAIYFLHFVQNLFISEPFSHEKIDYISAFIAHGRLHVLHRACNAIAV